MSICFDDLKKLEPSLVLNRPSSWNGKILTISTVKDLRPYSLVFIKDKKFLKLLAEALSNSEIPEGLIILTNKDLQEETFKLLPVDKIIGAKGVFAQVDNAPLAMARVSKLFFDETNQDCNDMVDGRQMGTAEIHPTAWIAQGAFLGANVKIGKDVQIFPGAVVLSNSEIGDGTFIFPNVVIYRFVKIGKNCRVHAGSVIGADGFGYQFHQGMHHKIWHIGSVIIEDNVEIGACTTIDRGTFSNTIIRSGTIIDNQVQIGHNCRIGKGVVLCGQTGFAGSVDMGDYCVAGGRAAFAPDIHVGNQCQIAGMAGVTGNLEDRAVVAGHPARPVKEWLRAEAKLRSLLKKGEE